MEFEGVSRFSVLKHVWSVAELVQPVGQRDRFESTSQLQRNLQTVPRLWRGSHFLIGTLGSKLLSMRWRACRAAPWTGERFFAALISAGTAAFASGPIAPKASAAWY